MIRNEKERNLLDRLRGMTVALATPLDSHNQLDTDALSRLIERVIEQGASGVFCLGWMGEQPLQLKTHCVNYVAG